MNETKNISVFISYSWDDEAHKKWVLHLADKMNSEPGIHVILDKFQMYAGNNILHFAETSIEKADKIIIIFTPDYKYKAKQRGKTVGYEYSIITTVLSKNIAGQDKVIPVLRAGTVSDSFSTLFQQFVYLDFSDDRCFAKRYKELLIALRKPPEVSEAPLPEQRLEYKRMAGFSKKLRRRIVAGFILTTISVITIVVFSMMNYSKHSLEDGPTSASIKKAEAEDSIPYATPTKPAANSNAGNNPRQAPFKLPPTPVIDKRGQKGDTIQSQTLDKDRQLPTKNVDELYETVYNASEGYRRVESGGRYGFIDKNGKGIAGTAEAELKYSYAEDFSEGLAVVMKGGRYGYINTHGEVVIDLVYSHAESFIGGTAKVRRNAECYYIDKQGNRVADCNIRF